MADAFYLPTPDGFESTELTRGPWHNDFQHGGPPAALLLRALSEPGFFTARLSIDLLRPVPIAPLRIEVEPGKGRTVRRPRARLLAGGKVVATATAIVVARHERARSEPIEPTPWPDPDTLDGFSFPFFQHAVGYHTAIDVRVAQGRWGSTPIGCWARPRVELVAGTPTTPAEKITLIADAQSGMGVPLDPLKWSFVNPDLTLYFERDPVDGWFGFDIRSSAGPQGSGLAQSEVRDAAGFVARSAQALVVREQ